MNRSLNLGVGVAAFGVATALSAGARADSITLFNNCSYEYATGCSSHCTAESINCSVQYVDDVFEELHGNAIADLHDVVRVDVQDEPRKLRLHELLQ